MTISTDLRPGGQRALRAMNEQLRPLARELQFSHDRRAGGPVVRVVDTESNLVLRQLGAGDARAVARALEYMQGMLLSTQA